MDFYQKNKEASGAGVHIQPAQERRGKSRMVSNYISVDLETTGLNPKTDRIIEIGALRVENGVETGTFHAMVNPGRLLDDKITELTGIRDEELTDAEDICQVFPRFLQFAGELPLLGHGILFDYSFLKKVAVNLKQPFERKGIDTLKIARHYLPELPSRSLGNLCIHYGIAHQAHRALEDARATHLLYRQLCQDFQVEGFEPVPLLFKVKKDSPITKSQEERLYKLLDKHKIQTVYDIKKLTKSEASRYTDRILAEYGR